MAIGGFSFILVDMHERRIQLSHADIAYWDNQKEDAPVLIFIHGYRGTHHGLARIADELNDYRIVIPDLPGFGDSVPLPTEHSVDAYVLFVKEFIDALHLAAPPVLIGHSFGSIIASHFAAKHHDYIADLVLINPIGAPALEGPRGIMTQFARLYYLIGKKLPERAGRAWLSWNFVTDIMSYTMTKSRDSTMRSYVKDQHRRYFSRFASARVASEAFDASVSNDVSAVAHEIPLRTLLIAGEKDDITHIDAVHELQKKFAAAKLVVIPDVGHLTHYEKAAEAAAAIRTFIP